MRNVIPTITPAPRRVHRKRRAVTPPAAAPGTVTVEASETNPGQLLWSFSAAMVGTLPASLPELEANDADAPGWISPSSVEYADAMNLIATYDGVSFEDGFSWRVLSAPAGLNFAGGQTLVVPEEG